MANRAHRAQKWDAFARHRREVLGALNGERAFVAGHWNVHPYQGDEVLIVEMGKDGFDGPTIAEVRAPEASLEGLERAAVMSEAMEMYRLLGVVVRELTETDLNPETLLHEAQLIRHRINKKLGALRLVRPIQEDVR